MKQIFDWLREQTQEALVSNKLRIGLGMKLVVPYNCFTDLINEAEAKWEAENTYRCNGNYNDNYKNALKVCPICGKPIKISEVE